MTAALDDAVARRADSVGVTDRHHRLERHGPLGTVLDVSVVAASPSFEVGDEFVGEDVGPSAIAERLVDEIERLELVFSVFDDSSELCRWRRGDLDDVSTELAAVLGDALRWQARSGGAFNPRASVLSDRWSTASETGVWPDHDELRTLAASIRTPTYSVQREGVIRRDGECAGVTLNAIAKGAIVDLAVERMVRRYSPEQLTVSAGGDVRHHGSPAAVIGIENPLRPYDNEPPLLTLALRGGALATSGGARRGVRVAGRWVSHVIDPRTGHPASGSASASVVAADVRTADAVATICTVMAVDEAMAWLEDVPEAEALLVGDDGSMVESAGFWRRVERLS